jgi:hypothetical protein
VAALGQPPRAGDCLAVFCLGRLWVRRAVIQRSRRRRGISHCSENTQSKIPRSALRKDDAYVLYIQRNRSDELASSFCLSWAAKRLSMLGMTAWWGLPAACRGKIQDLRDSVSLVALQFACTCVWRDYNDARKARFMSRVSSPEDLAAQSRQCKEV